MLFTMNKRYCFEFGRNMRNFVPWLFSKHSPASYFCQGMDIGIVQQVRLHRVLVSTLNDKMWCDSSLVQHIIILHLGTRISEKVIIDPYIKSIFLFWFPQGKRGLDILMRFGHLRPKLNIFYQGLQTHFEVVKPLKEGVQSWRRVPKGPLASIQGQAKRRSVQVPGYCKASSTFNLKYQLIPFISIVRTMTKNIFSPNLFMISRVDSQFVEEYLVKSSTAIYSTASIGSDLGSEVRVSQGHCVYRKSMELKDVWEENIIPSNSNVSSSPIHLMTSLDQSIHHHGDGMLTILSFLPFQDES